MSAAVRETLARLLREHGPDLCADRQRVEGLLRDLCPTAKRETSVLVAAVRVRVPLDLRDASGAALDEATKSRLTLRLYEEAGIATEFGEWAVVTWAAALGKSTPASVASPTVISAPTPISLPRVAPTVIAMPAVVPTVVSMPAFALPRNHRELRNTGAVNALAFSPDGQTLVTGASDGVVRLWEVTTGWELQRFQGDSRSVSAIAFGPDERRLCTVGAAGTAVVWDVAAGRARLTVPGSGALSCVAWCPSSGLLAAGGSDGAVQLIDPDARTGRAPAVRTLSTDAFPVRCLAWSRDGRMLAAGAEDGSVHVVEAASRKRIWRVLAHGEAVNALAFDDEDVLATAGDDGAVRLWELGAAKPLRSIDVKGAATAVAIDPSCSLLAAAAGDTVLLWDDPAGEPERLAGHTGAVLSVAFSVDGSLVASGGVDRTARLWPVSR